MIFVDDSTDDTPDVVREVASSPIPVRLIHRDQKTGGLGGAVLEGIEAAESDACLIMDGDLQHPPEKIPGCSSGFAGGMSTWSSLPATRARAVMTDWPVVHASWCRGPRPRSPGRCSPFG